MIYFSDVDVVGKLAACGFLPSLPDLLGVMDEGADIRYLPSLKARIQRPSKKLKNPEHQQHLEAFCQTYAFVEGAGDPDREEELNRAGLDAGEAILFAEAERTNGTVVTGDKRALIAYARASSKAQRSRVRVICWEQLLLRVRETQGYEVLRAGCCGGMDCDKLLGIVFSNGPATTEGHAVEALQSYLRQVESHSGDILVQFGL